MKHISPSLEMVEILGDIMLIYLLYLLMGDIEDLQQTIYHRKNYAPNRIFTDSLGIMRVSEAPGYGVNNVIKYTYGTAVFYIPAFVIGHIYSKLSSKYEANGFSNPYIFLLFISVIFWVVLGLYFLGNFLDNHVSSSTTNWVLATIGFATNLFYFSTVNNVMSHPIQFMLWSLLLASTHEYYYKGSSLTSFLKMAFAVGFITIIRPLELICILVPLFYGIFSIANIKDRVSHFLLEYRTHLLLGFLVGVLILIPQLWYWYHLTGHWIYDSYPNEKFDFWNPHLLDGWFSFQNGFFVYAPILIMILPGFYFLFQKDKLWALGTLIIFLVHSYISYSWWCWQYINGFGSRIMLDILPLLTLPFAYFIHNVFNKKNVAIRFDITAICFTKFDVDLSTKRRNNH